MDCVKDQTKFCFIFTTLFMNLKFERYVSMGGLPVVLLDKRFIFFHQKKSIGFRGLLKRRSECFAEFKVISMCFYQ